MQVERGLPGLDQDPVFIVPGLTADRWMYRGGKKALEAEGFSVDGMRMPWHGWSGIPQDAALLRESVEQAITKARAEGRDVSRVQLVGDSEGGLIARWFLQFEGGQDLVSRLVTNGTPHGGIRPFGSDRVAGLGQRVLLPPGVRDLLVSSPVMHRLNDDWMDFIRQARQLDPGFEVHSVGSRFRGIDHDGLVPVHATRLAGGPEQGVHHYLTDGAHSVKLAFGVESESLRVLMGALGSADPAARQAATRARGASEAWAGAHLLPRAGT